MSDFRHVPVPRHGAIVPLSLAHYQEMLLAQQLIEAAQADAAARCNALAAFVNAWDDQIAEHFQDEERLLTDWMPADDCKRLCMEHEQIMMDAVLSGELQHKLDPGSEFVRNIGERLRQHIRWEEHELFVRLQGQLSQEELDALQHQTQRLVLLTNPLGKRQARS